MHIRKQKVDFPVPSLYVQKLKVSGTCNAHERHKKYLKKM
jgi:hypothetical protein